MKGDAAGSQTTSTSGVTTTENPTAGPGSNTVSLTLSAILTPPTIQAAFSPAWIATGANSTLTFALGNPAGSTVSHAQFTATLTNATVANATLGGSCTGTTNSPALTVGATVLNLTIPSLPATGCTITVQVTSTTLGSNPATTSGVMITENPAAGSPANTVYLTVNPADIGFSYVHPDHLGTPRAITRPSDNQVVWRWDNTDPFGANAANENPSGAGTFTYNLRFPGQYYDQETQTHYNYFRDYDPVTGRYIESDPIGLAGGLSTYGYVGGGPLGSTDPEGLIESFTFELNKKKTSALNCECGMSIDAFSGVGDARNNPDRIGENRTGPIPPRTYYIVRRTAGTRLIDLARDEYRRIGRDSDPGKWFKLIPKGADADGCIIVNGTKRCDFRLHPGDISEGCITISDRNEYLKIWELLIKTKTEKMVNTNIEYYGTITVY